MNALYVWMVQAVKYTTLNVLYGHSSISIVYLDIKTAVTDLQSVCISMYKQNQSICFYKFSGNVLYIYRSINTVIKYRYINVE